MPFLVPFIPAIVGGVAAIGTAVIGAKTASKAASVGARGARRAGETEAEGYLQAGEQLQTGLEGVAEEVAPWRDVGQEAWYSMADEMGIKIEGREAGEAGGYKDTPYYQEERADIIDAMEKSASSRGLLRSGGTMLAIGQKAGQYAARSRESYLDRLSGMAGLGYRAASQQAAYGAEGVAGVSKATERAAQARATSYLTASQIRARGTRERGAAISEGVSGVAQSINFGLGMNDDLFGKSGYGAGGSS